jgi:predicted ribosome quality control (RQC) complex YloA/Tae2 family protein
MNWREIEVLVQRLRERLGESMYLERIIAPERPRFPAKYIKSEWALKLRGKRQEAWVVFSVRPRRPYLAFYPAKALRLAPEATRSPFDLEVSRHLKDSRLLSVETPPRERIILLWFAGDEEELGLVLLLIPAAPEALLIARDGRILTSTRKGREGKFEIPGGAQAPAEPPVRPELANPEDFHRAVDHELELEAFALRLAAAEKELRALAKHAKDRRRQSQTSVDEARSEPDWKRFGELMKATLPNAPEPEKAKKGLVRMIQDFESEEIVEVPADPKYSASDQTERFFQLARRKARRLEEAQIRLDGANEILKRAEGELARLPEPTDWAALEKLERAAGVQAEPAAPKAGKKKGGWLGKSFRSKDGLSILVGRSRDENLELTFKHARGNDLWMHVRGRPGAHVVIPLSPGKSAPLETLLDAAVLALHYSGGEKWGKTEVDYTFKKHVKRIKDSTEASYTHNKTLMVAPDQARLKRLLGGENSSS